MHNNENTDIKILHVFTGDVQPYIQLHIKNFTIPMNESPSLLKIFSKWAHLSL